MTMESKLTRKGSEDPSDTTAPTTSGASVQSIKAKHRLRRPPQNDESQQNEAKALEDGEGLETPRRAKSRRKQEKPESRSSGGSVVWTILMIGLIFSLVDVAYIMGFVERQNLLQDTRPNSSQRSFQDPPKIRGSSPKLEDKPLTESSNFVRESRNHTAGSLADKKPILDLLARAGIKVDPEEDKDLIQELPTWSEVVELYGPKPVIYGLEECDRFQHRSDPADHFVSTAGTFNTGTNLMAELLIANCHMQARMDKYGSQNRGVRWQVPWGKHSPPGDEAFRQGHKTLHDTNVEANNILPAVTIRDPVVWLHSMCHHGYSADWDHPDENHCPDFSLPELTTSVEYKGFKKEHKSILHLWNDYYQEYLNVSFPRIIVRFEDLVFHPEEVTKTVCECAGGSMKGDGKFTYIVDSAKKGEHAHGKERTGYVDAIVKYGSAKLRYKNYRFSADLEYIRDHVDKNLMELMEYPPADPSKVNGKR